VYRLQAAACSLDTTPAFVFRANQALILTVGVLPSDCGMSRYLLDAQFFTQSQLLSHRKRGISVMETIFLALART